MIRALPLAVLAAALAGCGAGEPEDARVDRLLVAAYTAPREAFEQAVVPAFRAHWRARTGRDVVVRTSYLGSGAQARAVIDGFPADVVVLALAPDVDAVARAGLVAPDWRARAGAGGVVARTRVVLAVRTGNPLGLRDFPDLARPGVEVLVPNPQTSGAAMWTFLALWGAAEASGADAEALVRAVARNVVVMDKGARESLVNFERGLGDVAVTYEQEVHVALRAGRRYDMVVPPATMLVEIPGAVVDRHVDARGTRPAAEAFLTFLAAPEGQAALAAWGFRPVDEPVPGTFGIERLGGWPAALARFFGPRGLLTRLIEEGQAR